MFPSGTPDWMTYLGYVVPHSYVNNIYQWANDMPIKDWEIATGIIIPIAFGTLTIWGGAKLLKFD